MGVPHRIAYFMENPVEMDDLGGYLHSWMVYLMENPNLKWIVIRDIPMTLETTTSVMRKNGVEPT